MLIEINAAAGDRLHGSDMSQDPSRQTRDLIERLHEQGLHGEAQHLGRAVEKGVRLTVRETLETLLTAIEAIDPVSETAIEELRVEIAKLLRPLREEEGP